MCSITNKNIGFEIMGTHGQFPSRGYKKRALDYVAVVISKDQLDEKYPIADGLHFLMINVSQLPLHYFINKGIKGKPKGTQNEKWNEKEFQDILYPNIKLKFELVKKEIHFMPAIENYNTKTIPKTSNFRKVGPFVLNKMPDEF